MKQRPKVLVIGAHVDECEFCAGGLSMLLAEKGCEVVFLNIIGDQSHYTVVGPEKNAQAVREAEEAALVLGARKILLGYGLHEFPPYDFEATKQLTKVIQEINPEIAMIHWVKDKWYDHWAAAINSLRALRWAHAFDVGDFKSNLQEVYAFESGQCQTFDFSPDFYVDISGQMDSIIESLQKFQALTEEGVSSLIEEKKALSQNRAIEAQLGENCKYAEGFVGLRWRAKGISVLPELLGDRFRMADFPRATREYSV